MKKTIISFIFLSLGTGLIAQNYTLQSAWDFYRLHKKNDNALNTALTENDIQGSPYAEKDFQDGYVVTTSDSKFVDLKLRYNIFNDRIEYMDESGAPLAFSYPDVINHVVIGNDKYVYSPYAVQKKIEKGFFRVVEEGKSALYVRKKIFFQEAVPPGAYKDAEPPKFLNKPDEYYIRI